MTLSRAALALLLVMHSTIAFAQITQAATSTPPDDTPSIRVGMLLFTDYTLQTSPETTDSDGNVIHPNSFNVGRSYINITGNISHIVGFRITPDIARETNAASSLNGSYEFRIKYACAVQFRRLDAEGLVRASGYPADAVAGFRGRHLPVSVSGHDVRRA